MSPSYIGALDIGGTKLAASIANAGGPLARVTQATQKTGSERAIPEQALALLDTACRQAGVAPSAVRHVGVASCGPFARTEHGLAVVAPNLCGGSGALDVPNDWQSIPLEQVLREQFSTVVIENDGTSALIGERTFGALQDEPDCAYVTWSTGIGFGLCVDGHVLRGKRGNAGHAGHMLLAEQSDALCGCGNRGDLEALAGGHNLGRRCGKPVRELFAGAAHGDAADLALVTEAARHFGRALYNLVAILDLRRIVVGGGIWSHHAAWLAPLVQAEIDSRFPLLTQGVSVQSAALGTLVTDLGALCLVMPAEWLPAWRQTQPWRALQE
ncbi:MAG TPA: ROK family protein [Burkholderiaceae bacterium]|nr:ROK family protein [Burkholderiaceae bacterium]